MVYLISFPTLPIFTAENAKFPDPSVFKNSPALPAAPGNLKVLSAAKVSGVVNLTLLPFECVKLSSLTLQSPLM